MNPHLPLDQVSQHYLVNHAFPKRQKQLHVTYESPFKTEVEKIVKKSVIREIKLN